MSSVQDKQPHFEQPNSDLECIHISDPLKESLHENSGLSSLVNTCVSHNVPCNVGSQGEQIKLGCQPTAVGDASFSVVLFLGVLQQETKLGTLKQELQLISMQHQVVSTLVLKVYRK